MRRLISAISKEFGHVQTDTSDNPPLFTYPGLADHRRHVVPPGDVAREIKIDSVTELGDVKSTTSLVKRDLGFQGRLLNHSIITYGDTMFTNTEGDDKFRGMTCNSVAISTTDPTRVLDPVVDDECRSACFLMPSIEEYGEDPSTHALGITNVVETSAGKGGQVVLRIF